MKLPMIILSSVGGLASLALGVSLVASTSGQAQADGRKVVAPAVQTVPGMPAVLNPQDLYSETSSSKLSEAVKGDLERVYVPNLRSNDVYVIDPAVMKVVDRFKVGSAPQHVVPAWDLKTLWVANNAERTKKGSLTLDDVVYRFDTSDGSVKQIKVGLEPHGLTVWPQPGRYSLGHTGNMR